MTKPGSHHLSVNRVMVYDAFCNCRFVLCQMSSCEVLPYEMVNVSLHLQMFHRAEFGPFIAQKGQNLSVFLLQFLAILAEHQQIIELNECIIIYIIQFSQDCCTI